MPADGETVAAHECAPNDADGVSARRSVQSATVVTPIKLALRWLAAEEFCSQAPALARDRPRGEQIARPH